jgi:hypothetical protein
MCADEVSDEDEGKVLGGIGLVNRSNSIGPQLPNTIDLDSSTDLLFPRQREISVLIQLKSARSLIEPSSPSGCM